MTVRYVITTFLVALGLAGLASTVSAEAPKTSDVQLLFVQSATSGAYDGKTLTLNGLSSTIYFTDRPKRIVGHVTSPLVKLHPIGGLSGHSSKSCGGHGSFSVPSHTLTIFGMIGMNTRRKFQSWPNSSGCTMVLCTSTEIRIGN